MRRHRTRATTLRALDNKLGTPLGPAGMIQTVLHRFDFRGLEDAMPAPSTDQRRDLLEEEMPAMPAAIDLDTTSPQLLPAVLADTDFVTLLGFHTL